MSNTTSVGRFFGRRQHQTTHKSLNLGKVLVDELGREPVPPSASISTCIIPVPPPRAYTQAALHSRVAVAALVVAIVDVVDPEPHREHRVLARPRRARGLLRDLPLEVVHLRDEVVRGERRLDERPVDRRAAPRVVVRQDERLVELHGREVDPVRADAGVPRVGGVAHRVPGRGDRAGGFEPAGGVRVSTVLKR